LLLKFLQQLSVCRGGHRFFNFGIVGQHYRPFCDGYCSSRIGPNPRLNLSPQRAEKATGMPSCTQIASTLRFNSAVSSNAAEECVGCAVVLGQPTPSLIGERDPLRRLASALWLGADAHQHADTMPFVEYRTLKRSHFNVPLSNLEVANSAEPKHLFEAVFADRIRLAVG